MSDENNESVEQERTEATSDTQRQAEELASVLGPVIGQAVGTAVDAALERAGAGTPQRQQVATEAPARSAARTNPGWERLYRSIPEDLRHDRTPENDVIVARWAKAVVYNDHQTLRELEGEHPEAFARDLNIGTAGDGGNLVPVPMANTIITMLENSEVIGPRSFGFTSENTSVEVPTEATKAAAAGAAEAAALTETSGTFGQVTLTKKKSYVYTYTSQELLDDTPFMLSNVLTRQAAESFATYNDAQDIADGDGTGTNQTDAIENNGSISVVDATVGAIAYTDLTALWHALGARYRSLATWMVPGAIAEDLSNLLDSNGRPILVDATNAGTPISGGQGAPGVGTIFGRPVVEVDGMTATVIAIGDLSRYAVLRHGALRVDASTHARFGNDQVAWRFIQRRDGAVLIPEAFKKSTGVT